MWTIEEYEEYYVMDGLGVKMHGLPLVYIYIYIYMYMTIVPQQVEFSSTLCGLVALRPAVCRVFQQSLASEHNELDNTRGGSCLVH